MLAVKPGRERNNYAGICGHYFEKPVNFDALRSRLADLFVLNQWCAKWALAAPSSELRNCFS